MIGGNVYQQILHPTDLSDDHFEVCAKAVKIAHQLKATLHLLHVIEPPTTLQIAQSLGFADIEKQNAQQSDAIAVMKTLGEALNIPPEHQCVVMGPINTSVWKKINEWSISLIIIGSHTPHLLPSFLEGTAQDMAQNAPCDVLTIRS